MFTAINNFFRLFAINLDSLCNVSLLGNVKSQKFLSDELKGTDLAKLKTDLIALGLKDE